MGEAMGARAMTSNAFTLSQADGSIKSDIRAPDGVRVDLQDL
jgi:hypothetical protein